MAELGESSEGTRCSFLTRKFVVIGIIAILLGAEFTKGYARRVGSRAKLENSVGRGSSDSLGD